MKNKNIWYKIWHKTGMIVIRAVEWVLWKLWPDARWDYLDEQVSDMDDYIHVDNICDAMSDSRCR